MCGPSCPQDTDRPNPSFRVFHESSHVPTTVRPGLEITPFTTPSEPERERKWASIDLPGEITSVERRLGKERPELGEEVVGDLDEVEKQVNPELHPSLLHLHRTSPSLLPRPTPLYDRPLPPYQGSTRLSGV